MHRKAESDHGSAGVGDESSTDTDDISSIATGDDSSSATDDGSTAGPDADTPADPDDDSPIDTYLERVRAAVNQFVTTLREGLDGADLAGGALVIAILYALTDFDETALAMLAGVVIGTPIAEALLDALGVGPASAGIAFGAIVVGAGASVAVSDAAFVGAAVAAIGCWILLDSVYTWRADGRRSGGDRLAGERRSNSLLRTAALRLLRPLRLFDPR